MSNLDELRLSVSKSKTFEQCPAKYNYSYNLKLPKKEWSFHALGSVAHRSLEIFHQTYIQGSDAPFNKTMGAAFKTAQNEYRSKLTPTITSECRQILDSYLRATYISAGQHTLPTVLAVEKSFEIPIDNQIVLNGAIDRIQIDPDGVLNVSDYKTTKNKKYLKDDWFQLLTYAWVMLQENPELERVRASYILLRHDNEPLTREFSLEEIKQVKEKYFAYAAKIRAETEFKPQPSNLCTYCDFLDICDAGKAKVKPINKQHGEQPW
jgi:ATP-dependent helicase/DNAse subunit B